MRLQKITEKQLFLFFFFYSMILSAKTGIITNVTEAKTKAGKPMIIIAHTVGNNDNIQKVFIFPEDPNFNNIFTITCNHQEIIIKNEQLYGDNCSKIKKNPHFWKYLTVQLFFHW